MAEQQQAIAEAEAEQASAFAISQEDIDAVLMGGSHVSEGKFRIYNQFLKQEPAAENVKFLKNEYGTGGAYPAVIGREISWNGRRSPAKGRWSFDWQLAPHRR